MTPHHVHIHVAVAKHSKGTFVERARPGSVGLIYCQAGLMLAASQRGPRPVRFPLNHASHGFRTAKQDPRSSGPLVVVFVWQREGKPIMLFWETSNVLKRPSLRLPVTSYIRNQTLPLSLLVMLFGYSVLWWAWCLAKLSRPHRSEEKTKKVPHLDIPYFKRVNYRYLAR